MLVEMQTIVLTIKHDFTERCGQLLLSARQNNCASKQKTVLFHFVSNFLQTTEECMCLYLVQWESRGPHPGRRVAPTAPKRFVISFIPLCQTKDTTDGRKIRLIDVPSYSGQSDLQILYPATPTST
ncbi:hypothetical protein CSKR_109372 [Clonorchis sinensis]|uniref:Uncharacterized protein n=1 Tax=Clonorchis sinensis TaxID=79923 RepID=A0A419PN89_CLOSI|nr:hypothetical protein CSKR_109372 [Clonorchis sinensis]